jgi:hypothetical protein
VILTEEAEGRDFNEGDYLSHANMLDDPDTLWVRRITFFVNHSFQHQCEF